MTEKKCRVNAFMRATGKFRAGVRPGQQEHSTIAMTEQNRRLLAARGRN